MLKFKNNKIIEWKNKWTTKNITVVKTIVLHYPVTMYPQVPSSLNPSCYIHPLWLFSLLMTYHPFNEFLFPSLKWDCWVSELKIDPVWGRLQHCTVDNSQLGHFQSKMIISETIYMVTLSATYAQMNSFQFPTNFSTQISINVLWLMGSNSLS